MLQISRVLAHDCVSTPEWDPIAKGEQYTEIDHKFALMQGSRSAPIGILPLLAFSMLHQSARWGSVGGPIPVLKRTRRKKQRVAPKSGESRGLTDSSNREAAGVIFVEENGEGPGIRLRKERQFLLTPIDLSHPAWESSIWKKAAWTVAHVELEARRRLTHATIVAAPRRAGYPPILVHAWESGDLATCEERACPFPLVYGQVVGEGGQPIE